MFRGYDLDMFDGARRAALGIAISRRCDLFVAAVQGGRDAGAMQRAALAFLKDAGDDGMDDGGAGRKVSVMH